MSVSYLIRQQLYVITKPNNKIKELIKQKKDNGKEKETNNRINKKKLRETKTLQNKH